MRRIAAALLALLVLASSVARSAPDEDAAWKTAMLSYARDPFRNRRMLLDLERDGTRSLPPLVVLALADAQLRGGRYRAARARFTEVLQRNPPDPLPLWAEMGLGWIGMATGDEETARQHFGRVETTDSASGPIAALLVAILEGSAGRSEGALQELGRLAGDGELPSGLRDSASLGRAYIQYWIARYDLAEKAFAELAARNPSGPLADDARYGAARARWEAGDREGAEAAFHAIAEESARGSGARAAPAALRDLEPRALMRAAFERYRRAPLQPPEHQADVVLDGNGAALARAALRSLEDPAAPEAASRSHTRPLGQRATPVASVREVERANEGILPSRAERRSPQSSGLVGFVLLAALLAASVVALGLRRR